MSLVCAFPTSLPNYNFSPLYPVKATAGTGFHWRAASISLGNMCGFN